MERPRGRAVITMTAAALAACLLGCGEGQTRRIRLERVKPEADPACGAPADARTLVLTALGEFAATEATARDVVLPADGAADVSIDGFPPETNSLAVEVRGFGGAVVAAGRTPLFSLEELEDGDSVPVFMAPLDGFCPTGPPGQGRDAPLAARVGAGVLVAGGLDAAGNPVDEVEQYDPATGQFSSLDVLLYGTGDAGLVGASMTAMPDGRVVVAGGDADAFQVYDPESADFGAAQFLRRSRAHHAAVALDADRLLLAAGCARLEGVGCAPESELSTTTILHVSTGAIEDGPRLDRIRVGGRALREADGRVLLVGGVDADGRPVLDAERIDPDPGRAIANQLVAGTGASAAVLAAGGALTGFAPLGAPASPSAAVVPPGATRVTAIATADPRTGPVLVALEGGGVLVVGGADSGAASALYEPVRGAIRRLPGDPGEGDRRGAAAVALDDGTVLLVGGVDGDGAPRGDAWIFRPDLIGPWTSARSATFATPELAAPMVARDPGRARLVDAADAAPAYYRLESSGAGDVPTEWAVLAGPRFTWLTLEASLATESGGAAVLLWFRDGATTGVLSLRPGERARLAAIEGGRASDASACTGEPIGADDLVPLANGGHRLAVVAAGGRLTAALDGQTILRCAVEPPGAGLVGVAPLGEGAVLRLEFISASR